MRPMDREFSALKLLDRLGSQLRSAREPEQALRVGLRETHDFFQAAQTCIATLLPGKTHADLLLTRPTDGRWDLDTLSSFIRHERPPLRPGVLIGPLRRRGAAWGAVAVRREDPARGGEDLRSGEMIRHSIATMHGCSSGSPWCCRMRSSESIVTASSTCATG